MSERTELRGITVGDVYGDEANCWILTRDRNLDIYRLDNVIQKFLCGIDC